MVNTNDMDVFGWLRKHLDADGNDLLREIVRETAKRLMAAEVDVLCGAGYGEVSPERVNSRNGYRDRRWDTRAGSIELPIPKLGSGSYFPDWLLEPRRRAERALVSLVADCSPVATWAPTASTGHSSTSSPPNSRRSPNTSSPT